MRKREPTLMLYARMYAYASVHPHVCAHGSAHVLAYARAQSQCAYVMAFGECGLSMGGGAGDIIGEA